MSSFRDDGALALEWVASYLEHVRELPVLSRVEPGAIRAALPSAPPDDGEPFSAVLDDLDSILLPGLTHWQTSLLRVLRDDGLEPGVLPSSSPASTSRRPGASRRCGARGAHGRLAAAARRPAEFRGHIEDTASTGVLQRCRRQSLQPDRRVLVCWSMPPSPTSDAVLDLELRRSMDDGFSCGLNCSSRTVHAVVAPSGRRGWRRSIPSRRSPAVRRGGTWLHVDPVYAGGCDPPELRCSSQHRACGLDRREPRMARRAQDVRAWTRREDDFRRSASRVQPPDDAVNRAGSFRSPALSCAEAGPSSAVAGVSARATAPRARSPRRALRERMRGARLEVTAPGTFRWSASGTAERRENERLLERVTTRARCSSRTPGSPIAASCASRSGTSDDGGDVEPADVLRREAAASRTSRDGRPPSVVEAAAGEPRLRQAAAFTRELGRRRTRRRSRRTW